MANAFITLGHNQKQGSCAVFALIWINVSFSVFGGFKSLIIKQNRVILSDN